MFVKNRDLSKIEFFVKNKIFYQKSIFAKNRNLPIILIKIFIKNRNLSKIEITLVNLSYFSNSMLIDYLLLLIIFQISAKFPTTSPNCIIPVSVFTQKNNLSMKILEHSNRTFGEKKNIHFVCNF